MRPKVILTDVCSILALLVALAASGTALAQSGPTEDGESLRSKTQNPVAAMISLPFMNDVDFGAQNGTANILNVQPVIPFQLGPVNFISRVIVPIIHVQGAVNSLPPNPSPIPGEGATGLGDINYSLLLSPAKTGKLIWGIGSSISLPTATDEQLGTKKWSAGLSVVLLGQPKPWSLGLLVRQLWSFAGESERRDVSQLMMQPFVFYNLSKGWFLFSDPIILANWKASEGNKWSVPLGGGAGRLVKIGSQPINMRVGPYFNVKKPDGAPDWSLRISVALLFPI